MKSNLPRLVVMLSLPLVAACDGCFGPEPYDGPCTYVYANGEPADEFSRWNHAQTSAQPQYDVMTSLAVVTGERGGYVMGGMRGGNAYFVMNDEAGTQLSSYAHGSEFSEFVTLATGIRSNSVAVNISRGQMEANDSERAVISMAQFATSAQDPAMFEPRPLIAADGIDEDTLAGRTVDSEVVTAALVSTSSNTSMIAGTMTLSASPQNAASQTFFIATLRDGAATSYATQEFERFPMEQTHLFASDDTQGQIIVDIVERPDGRLALLIANPDGTPEADRSPQRLLQLSAFDALTEADDSGVDLFTANDVQNTYASVRSMGDALLLVGQDPTGNGVVTLLSTDGDRTAVTVESDLNPILADVTATPDQIVVVGTTAGPPQQVFLVGFDRALAAEQWRRTYKDGMADTEFATGLRILPDGDTGSFWVGGDTNFEHSRIRGFGGEVDGYVHRFDAVGVEWGYRNTYCRERWELEGRTFNADDPIQ